MATKTMIHRSAASAPKKATLVAKKSTTKAISPMNINPVVKVTKSKAGTQITYKNGTGYWSENSTSSKKKPKK